MLPVVSIDKVEIDGSGLEQGHASIGSWIAAHDGDQ